MENLERDILDALDEYWAEEYEQDYVKPSSDSDKFNIIDAFDKAKIITIILIALIASNLLPVGISRANTGTLNNTTDEPETTTDISSLAASDYLTSNTINESNVTSVKAANEPPQIKGSLNAGGFVNEPFTWNYSFYVSDPDGDEITATSDDPEHISWDGLVATFNYSKVGNYSVNLTFTDSHGANVSGTAIIKIVEKKEWDECPKVMCTYPIREDARNGNVNAEKTVQALKDIGANTLVFFLGNEERYNNFISFLNQTKDSDIKIWAGLPPRCEDWYGSPCYPYGGDYEAWAEFFANLSLEYPQLEAFTIDDFHAEDLFPRFTPEYVEKFMNAKNRINPNLKFIPTLYYDVYDEMKYFRDDSPYKPILKDGTFMWYWASYGYSEANLTELENYIDEATATIHPVPFITGIYPIRYAKTVDQIFYPPNFVREMTELALQNSDGVGLFQVPLYVYDLDFFYNATIFKQLPNDDPAFEYRLGLPSGPWGTYHGWYQGITQQISLPENLENASISFEIRDNRDASGSRGYHVKQLLVNDKVVWEADVCADGTEVIKINEDLTPYLSGDKANITIRLFDKRAVGWYEVNIYIRNITIYINNTLIPNNFTFKSGIENISKYIEVYNTVGQLFKTPRHCH